MDERRAGESCRGLDRQQLRLRQFFVAGGTPQIGFRRTNVHVAVRQVGGVRSACPLARRSARRRSGCLHGSSHAVASLCPAPRRGTGLAARGSGFGRGSRGVIAARNANGGGGSTSLAPPKLLMDVILDNISAITDVKMLSCSTPLSSNTLPPSQPLRPPRPNTGRVGASRGKQQHKECHQRKPKFGM